MTLLVRNEADIVDAQVAFHLHAGVDFVIATDNGSDDGTLEILERYARTGRPAPAPGGRRGHAPGRVGHPHGPAGGDRLRGGLGDQLRRRRVLVAPRRHAQGCSRPGSRALRRRPRVLATLPASTRRRRELRRADDRPALHTGLSGRQDHDLPRASEGRSSRRSGRRDRARQPQRRRAGAGARCEAGTRSRSSTSRFGRLEQLERKARGGWLRTPPAEQTEHQLLLDEAYREGKLDAFYAEHAISDAALERGLADGSLAVDTRLRDVLRTLREPDGRYRVPEAGTSLTFETPGLADTAAYAAEASVLVGIDGIVRAEQRVAALEARLARLRTLPRR